MKQKPEFTYELIKKKKLERNVFVTGRTDGIRIV